MGEVIQMIPTTKKCPECQRVLDSSLFYKYIVKNTEYNSGYCIQCSMLVQKKVKAAKRGEVYAPKPHHGSKLTRFMRQSHPRPKPYEYIEYVRDLVNELEMLLKQMNYNGLNPALIYPPRLWSDVKLTLDSINQTVKKLEEK